MISAFESVLVQWTVANADIGDGKVFLVNQNLNIPESPYISIDITSGPNEISTGRNKYNPINENMDYIATYHMVVQFNIYGADCLEICDRLTKSLSLSSVKSFFRENNVVNTKAFNFGIINDASIQNVNFLRRTVMELDFLIESTIENAEEMMANMNINQEYDNESEDQDTVIIL